MKVNKHLQNSSTTVDALCVICWHTLSCYNWNMRERPVFLMATFAKLCFKWRSSWQWQLVTRLSWCHSKWRLEIRQLEIRRIVSAQHTISTIVRCGSRTVSSRLAWWHVVAVEQISYVVAVEQPSYVVAVEQPSYVVAGESWLMSYSQLQ